jgi:hypothetical protein
MTIPANNWCSTCEEACHDHATTCTVCGDTLGPPPQNSSSRNATTTTSSSGVRAIPDFLTQDVRLAGRELHGMLADLSGQVRGLNDLARNALAGDGVGGGWQTIPAELLEPQQGRPSGRPTSKRTLASIPRITLEDHSSLFRQTTLQLFYGSSSSLSFQPISGEFGPSNDIKVLDASIVVASPRTGKGGLTEETKKTIRSQEKSLVYMERGDGMTFVRKAFMAQEAGASAVVIGNNTSQPWPYVMKDSKREAQTLSLEIPVVMVKQEDGKRIVQCCQKNMNSKANFSIQTQPQDCVICRETFQSSQSVVQLPICGHVFHDACALVWLEKQNTCPYCRLELPTDDTEYEEERRRQRRTHAGSSSNSNESEWSAYYG